MRMQWTFIVVCWVFAIAFLLLIFVLAPTIVSSGLLFVTFFVIIEVEICHYFLLRKELDQLLEWRRCKIFTLHLPIHLPLLREGVKNDLVRKVIQLSGGLSLFVAFYESSDAALELLNCSNERLYTDIVIKELLTHLEEPLGFAQAASRFLF